MSNPKGSIDKVFTKEKLKYLELLGKHFPTISKASTEIINLQAILNLPKGTEHFVSDIHGEYESFIHVLKNASGVIKLKVDDVYGMEMTETEKKKLSFLIYYPKEMLKKTKKSSNDIKEWYEVRLYQLIKMARNAASKYTRSKVRKALPPRFLYILEELLHENDSRKDKEEYYRGIIKTIIDIDKAEDFIIALSNLIQRLVIDQLHIIGDIFDRGPGADIIMDRLCSYHSVDIQWGNHDVLWMGAAAGSRACICNVIRISLRYSNTDTLEDGYGINLLPLATFAIEHYKDEKNPFFLPKDTSNKNIGDSEVQLIAKMHKAISVIQFKLEGQIIERRKEFNMDDRKLLDNLNIEKKEIKIEGKTYKLNDNYFPTIDKKNPYKLTKEEKKVIEKLTSSFLSSGKLQEHIRFLYAKGSLYLKHNSNLLFHACVPMTENGELYNLSFWGKDYKGKSLYDMFDLLAREAYFSKESAEKKQYGRDILWYLWCGPRSPLFGKRKMTTFERYFIDDKETHNEPKDYFFKFRDNEETCNMILKDFDLEPNKSHIFCGHVPVKVKKGESPIKANGKLLVIDGGFSKAYQGQTGIAGYTLIYNSHGLQLVSHEHFHSSNEAIEQEKDIHSVKRILEHSETRIRISSTDVGKELKKQIEELKLLLAAYRKGLIKEKP